MNATVHKLPVAGGDILYKPLISDGSASSMALMHSRLTTDGFVASMTSKPGFFYKVAGRIPCTSMSITSWWSNTSTIRASPAQKGYWGKAGDFRDTFPACGGASLYARAPIATPRLPCPNTGPAPKSRENFAEFRVSQLTQIAPKISRNIALPQGMVLDPTGKVEQS